MSESNKPIDLVLKDEIMARKILKKALNDHLIFTFFPLFVTVCKDPPYKVEESGYAGFILPIEVYFRNKVFL